LEVRIRFVRQAASSSCQVSGHKASDEG
jgi:hypothetical protein